MINVRKDYASVLLKSENRTDSPTSFKPLGFRQMN